MFCNAVYQDGKICLDILQNNWSPIYDVTALLQSIQSLLSDPNTSSPANPEAAKLFDENRKAYENKVKEVVEQSWEELDAEEDDEEEEEGEGSGENTQ